MTTLKLKKILWPTVPEQSPWLLSDSSVIANNPWVRYCHIIPPVIKMLNQNMTPTWNSGNMFEHHDRQVLSLEPTWDTRSLSCKCWLFFFHVHEWRYQLAPHCYFRSNPTQRGYRKRMIEICQVWASFQITSQRLDGPSQDNNKERLVFWPWNTRNIPENK